MRHMTARFPGRCHATGQPINPGDPILYDPRTRRAYTVSQEPAISPGAALALELDPDLDPDTADSVGRYLEQTIAAALARALKSDLDNVEKIIRVEMK